MIGIIDYGMGNIHSVKKALESMGASVLVTNNSRELEKADKIIFPGVGAFGDALEELRNRSLDEAIRKHVASGKIFLGICLGMQVLFEASEESEGVKGLGLLKGRVLKFNAENGLKVPHMGWNQLKIGQRACPLLKNMPDNADVYFCHSYYPQAKDNAIVVATCDYGINFAAVVMQGNIYGVQFHPEKSQGVGLKIIENFVKC